MVSMKGEGRMIWTIFHRRPLGSVLMTGKGSMSTKGESAASVIMRTPGRVLTRGAAAEVPVAEPDEGWAS